MNTQLLERTAETAGRAGRLLDRLYAAAPALPDPNIIIEPYEGGIIEVLCWSDVVVSITCDSTAYVLLILGLGEPIPPEGPLPRALVAALQRVEGVE